ncbi:MAG: TlpA family protein disulfide reductase [Desulfobulbaceae bacterium]|nr:TlpA family protein disulfide reductase [Desulfobulbaceae bacterium]
MERIIYVMQITIGITMKHKAFLFFLLLVLLLPVFLGCVQEKKIKPLQLGDTAPDFAAKDLEGKVIILSNLRGSPVILRFFETNCRFCRADTPAFTKFYLEHKDQGLQVLYIGSFYEKVESLQAFADELGLVFPIAMDIEAGLADLYDIRAYPQTVFISPDQKILAAILGGVGEAELQEIMGKYLEP